MATRTFRPQITAELHSMSTPGLSFRVEPDPIAFDGFLIRRLFVDADGQARYGSGEIIHGEIEARSEAIAIAAQMAEEA